MGRLLVEIAEVVSGARVVVSEVVVVAVVGLAARVAIVVTGIAVRQESQQEDRGEEWCEGWDQTA